MKSHQIRNSLILLLTALIWGTAFVAQSVATDFMGPFTFNGIRFIIGGIVLLPCIFLLERRNKKQQSVQEKRAERKTLWRGGISCGILLCVASSFQQFGIGGTSVGKTGFITALYIILVPIFGIFMHKRAGAKLWVSVGIAIVGLYLLCMKKESFSINFYDFIVLLCAVTFALHILCVDYFSPKVDGVKLSCIQFFVCGIISLLMMAITEHPEFIAIAGAWKPIAYAGIMSCGVAYTLQVIGQKDLNPVIASLIMSLESVVSAISGWLILNQQLSKREVAGCIVMFAAIILAQLPGKKKKE